MIITFSVIPERRFLYYLLPFLIIFATIPIQRLIEYGLSTFSFTTKAKTLLFNSYFRRDNYTFIIIYDAI